MLKYHSSTLISTENLGIWNLDEFVAKDTFNSLEVGESTSVYAIPHVYDSSYNLYNMLSVSKVKESDRYLCIETDLGYIFNIHERSLLRNSKGDKYFASNLKTDDKLVLTGNHYCSSVNVPFKLGDGVIQVDPAIAWLLGLMFVYGRCTYENGSIKTLKMMNVPFACMSPKFFEYLEKNNIKYMQHIDSYYISITDAKLLNILIYFKNNIKRLYLTLLKSPMDVLYSFLMPTLTYIYNNAGQCPYIISTVVHDLLLLNLGVLVKFSNKKFVLDIDASKFFDILKVACEDRCTLKDKNESYIGGMAEVVKDMQYVYIDHIKTITVSNVPTYSILFDRDIKYNIICGLF